MNQMPALYMIYPQIKTVDVEFNKLLVNTISGASNEAASATSGVKKLAAKKVIFTFLESLYVLVQCTPDLSTSDCNQCLLLANLSLSICCNNNRGVRVLFPSCKYFRFDNYSFFNEVAFDAMVARPLSCSPPSISRPNSSRRSFYFLLYHFINHGMIIWILLS